MAPSQSPMTLEQQASVLGIRPFATASIRTWLAGAAMSGILARDKHDELTAGYAARMSVQCADALLKELVK